jgi:hypothetical protein
MQENKRSLKNKIIESIQRPNPKQFCFPFLTEGQITMLYAPTGIGKSQFAFNMALAVAKGSKWLDHQCEKGKILFVDGEMGAYAWVRRIPKKQVYPSEVCDYFDMINPEDYEETCMIPNMGDPSLRSYWLKLMEPYDIIIIDNYLTTVYQEDPKDTEFTLWNSFQKLLIKLRKAGKAIMIVHHASKSGVQYGTVLKTNIVNLVIRLKEFPQQLLDNGITWEVKIEKDREFNLEGSKEFGMDIVFTDYEVHTKKRDIRKMRYEVVKDCVVDGMTKLEAATFLKVETHEIASMYQRAVKEKSSDKETMPW